MWIALCGHSDEVWFVYFPRKFLSPHDELSHFLKANDECRLRKDSSFRSPCMLFIFPGVLNIDSPTDLQTISQDENDETATPVAISLQGMKLPCQEIEQSGFIRTMFCARKRNDLCLEIFKAPRIRKKVLQ